MHFPSTELELLQQGMDIGRGQETGSLSQKHNQTRNSYNSPLCEERQFMVPSSPREHVPTSTVSTTDLQWAKYCLDLFQGALSPNAHCDAPSFPRGIMPYKDKMPPGNATQPRHLFPLPNVVQPFRSHN